VGGGGERERKKTYTNTKIKKGGPPILRILPGRELEVTNRNAFSQVRVDYDEVMTMEKRSPINHRKNTPDN
jgi:hypothetical protein